MSDSREDCWRYAYDDDEDIINIHALRWYVYQKKNYQLINREFLVTVPYLKGGNTICNCVKDIIIKENEYYKAIGIRGFDCKIFEEEQGGGVQKGLYRYPYLRHLIELWPGGWVKKMTKINVAVDKKNCLDKYGVRNGQFIILQGTS